MKVSLWPPRDLFPARSFDGRVFADVDWEGKAAAAAVVEEVAGAAVGTFLCGSGYPLRRAAVGWLLL